MIKTCSNMLNNTGNISIFAGGFGSGKSELALNYAFERAKEVDNLTLADLDLVNPYFVSRDLKELLEQNGIKLSAPRGEFAFGDVPHIPPEIISVLKQDREMIIDVAGDEIGSIVLGYLRRYIEVRPYRFHLVLNPYRPFAQDIESVRELKEALENASRLKFTSIISNPNLVEETDLSTIKSGHEKVLAYAQNLHLPVDYLTVDPKFYSDVANLYGKKVKTIKLYLRPNL